MFTASNTRRGVVYHIRPAFANTSSSHSSLKTDCVRFTTRRTMCKLYARICDFRDVLCFEWCLNLWRLAACGRFVGGARIRLYFGARVECVCGGWSFVIQSFDYSGHTRTHTLNPETDTQNSHSLSLHLGAAGHQPSEWTAVVLNTNGFICV